MWYNNDDDSEQQRKQQQRFLFLYFFSILYYLPPLFYSDSVYLMYSPLLAFFSRTKKVIWEHKGGDGKSEENSL